MFYMHTYIVKSNKGSKRIIFSKFVLICKVMRLPHNLKLKTIKIVAITLIYKEKMAVEISKKHICT